MPQHGETVWSAMMSRETFERSGRCRCDCAVPLPEEVEVRGEVFLPKKVFARH